MLEKGKISGLQMTCIFYASVVPTYWITMPSTIDNVVGRDSWMTPIFSCVISYLIVYVVYQLSMLYPGQTPIEYIPRIIGKWPGKVVGLGFLLYLLHIVSVTTHEFFDLINAKYLPFTPFIVIVLPLLLLAGYMVRQGVEVLGRFAFITIFYWIFVFMLYVFLTIPDMDIHNLFPVMEHGSTPQIKGVFLHNGWSSQAVFLSFMMPFLNKGSKKLLWGIGAVSFVAFDLVAAIIVPKMIYGTIMPDIAYPVLAAGEIIKIADFLEHIDLLIIADWIILYFVKMSIYIYILSLGTAQLTKLSTYRPIVFPICILISVVSLMSIGRFSDIKNFLEHIYPYYTILPQEAIPILLLIIAWFRTKGKRGRNILPLGNIGK
ncbi:endospore germination permease [Paenibacillus solisilvae]|uniref:Endospore germination permease n=1 Tax=Paenibacillus solisilvae TaxID=2486751 RepID=A0ABW0W1A0_9BACL